MGIAIHFNSDGTFFVDNAAKASSVRENKGHSKAIVLRDFTAIDLETTGLSPEYDEIIELAAIRYRDGEPVATYEQLVNPGVEIDEFITELTGITNDMLSSAPKLCTVLSSFISFVGSDIVVGHNVSFDVNFIYDACVDNGLPYFSNDYIDTLRLSRKLFKEWPDHKLDTMISKLCGESRSQHRALTDTEFTARCYLLMAASDGFEEAMKPAKEVKAKDITAIDGLAVEDSPLYKKVCVFTGALESFTRREAMQIVANIGGICGDGVTKKTNFLVLGNNDYCSSIKDGKSTKQKKAEKLILAGADLQIIPESVFLEMIAEGKE